MKAFFSSLLLIFALSVQAQILTPVKWSFDSKHLGGDEFELIYTAKIDDGWYVYSQYLESDDGPIATNLNYDEGSHFTKVGKAEENEANRKKGFDDIFEMNVVKYSKKFVITQKVKATDLSKPITGYLNYMTCDHERCLPPTDADFDFTLKADKKVEPKTETGATEQGKKSNVKSKLVPTKTEGVATNKSTTTKSQNTTKANSKPAKKEDLKKTIDKKPNAETLTLATASTAAPSVDGSIMRPVQWVITSKQTGDEYSLVFQANLAKPWKIYSQFTEDGGPIPTTFYFNEESHYTRVGKVVEEGKKKEGPDPLFEGVTVSKFVEGPVVFTQKLKVTDPSKTISGEVEFMSCDDEMCTPPMAVPFVVNFANNTASIGEDSESASTAPGINSNTEVENKIGAYGIPKPQLDTPLSSCGEEATVATQKGIWNIFFLGFLGGLVALLTPCVFPMIPLTVSFFTKGGESKKKGLRNAFLYGFFIFLVYILLSVPFHLLDGVNPDILNDISTNVWLNIAFFAIFLFFAFSFFGYYELTLPSSWSNKASQAEGAGGILGIFFMALTLAIVSFSCTGPILGSLLVGSISSTGGAMQLTSGMAGFGLALALPFGLFAAFPRMMNALPKSGGWLNTVKVVLGFLELALALKFLSNADLVRRWGLLKIEPFLILWIIIGIGLALYLFGKIKFPHDSPIKKLSPIRIGLGVLSLGFVAYLATGLFYNEESKSLNSLTLLSGLAPPACYSIWNPCDCPQNLSCYKDLDKGLAEAKETGKPIMIDFTGHACVNCRKMEEHVWPTGSVMPKLDDYVLISLYVDDKRELPEVLEVEKVDGGKRKLRNIGNKWSYFQTTYFQTNTQPYYVLLAPDGTLLNQPVGYTPDEEEYADFLRCGLDAYNQWSAKKQLSQVE